MRDLPRRIIVLGDMSSNAGSVQSVNVGPWKPSVQHLSGELFHRLLSDETLAVVNTFPLEMMVVRRLIRGLAPMETIGIEYISCWLLVPISSGVVWLALLKASA